MWRVKIRYWKIGKGYTHIEEFEILDTIMTADEWFRKFQENSDTPFTPENIGDGINVEVWHYSTLISEFFVDEEELNGDRVTKKSNGKI